MTEEQEFIEELLAEFEKEEYPKLLEVLGMPDDSVSKYIAYKSLLEAMKDEPVVDIEMQNALNLRVQLKLAELASEVGQGIYDIVTADRVRAQNNDLNEN